MKVAIMNFPKRFGNNLNMYRFRDWRCVNREKIL
jgi:hypothetical protein